MLILYILFSYIYFRSYLHEFVYKYRLYINLFVLCYINRIIYKYRTICAIETIIIINAYIELVTIYICRYLFIFPFFSLLSLNQIYTVSYTQPNSIHYLFARYLCKYFILLLMNCGNIFFILSLQLFCSNQIILLISFIFSFHTRRAYT